MFEFRRKPMRFVTNNVIFHIYFIYFLLYLYIILHELLIGHNSLSKNSISLPHSYTISTPCSLDGRTYFMLYEVLYVDIPRKIKNFKFFVSF